MTGLFQDPDDVDTLKPAPSVTMLVGWWLGVYAFSQSTDNFRMRELARKRMDSLYSQVAASAGMFNQIEARRRAERRHNPNIL